MKQHLKSVLSLTIICAVVAVLLGAVNGITAPIIEEQQEKAANEALVEVLPGGEGFEEIDLSSYELPATITKAYREKNGGYVFQMTTAGYATGFVVMCGVDAEGKVTGATCITSGETLGVEKEYGKNLVGATKDTVDGVDTVAGATKTTLAYRNAAKDALNAVIILSGGSVDLRDEAQILADNLSAALPAGEGEFEPVFIIESVEDISAVYRAKNGAGYVFVTGETFVATDTAGTVLSTVSDDVKTAVETQAKKLLAVTKTEIDLSKYADMPSQVQKAYNTSTGNYVFELRAAGFGINGDAWYNPSGEYIYLQVSATADGKIIACETISQKETNGIGSACAEPDFYTQFNGKEESNYKEIDAISGATITTNGYKTAVSKVFEAIRILKGGA